MTKRPLGNLRGTTHKVTLPPCPPIPEDWMQPGADIPPSSAYVTVNKDDDGKIVEVFLTYKKSGLFQGTTNVVCRLASLALRWGIPLDDVLDTMRGQSDGLPPVWWGEQGSVKSVADAITKVLEAEARRGDRNG